MYVGNLDVCDMDGFEVRGCLESVYNGCRARYVRLIVRRRVELR
jgi:hypothetical protein